MVPPVSAASRDSFTLLNWDPLTKVKVFYAFSFSFYAVTGRMVVLFYESIGLSAGQVGVLIALLKVSSTLANPMWAAYADQSKSHRFMYCRNVLLSNLFLLHALDLPFVLRCFLVLVMGAISGSYNCLTDSLSIAALIGVASIDPQKASLPTSVRPPSPVGGGMEDDTAACPVDTGFAGAAGEVLEEHDEPLREPLLENQGVKDLPRQALPPPSPSSPPPLDKVGARALWGQARLWGAITWGLMNCLVGGLFDISASLFGEAYSAAPMFILFLLTSLSLATFTPFLLPPTTSSTRHVVSLYSVAEIAFYTKSNVMFFLNICIIGAGFALVENLLFVAMSGVFLGMAGASNLICGLSVLITVIFEIPIFAQSKHILEEYGVYKMILVGQLAWVVRAFGYSLLHTAWVVLLLEPLHGVTYSLVWTAAVHETSHMCPPGLEASCQSLLSLSFGGIGPTFGTTVGGILFDEIGSASTFRVFALLVLMSLALFSWVVFKFGLPVRPKMGVLVGRGEV